MKKTKFIVLFLLFGVLFFIGSCTKKDDKELLRNVTDGLRGRYQCKSITFLNGPVDLDDDGKSHEDLIEEFKTFGNSSNVIRTFLRISPVSDYNEEGSINVEVPMQGLNFEKSSGMYYIDTPFGGNGAYMCFRYSVDREGKVSLWADNTKNTDFSNDIGDEIEYIDYIYTKGDKILKLENGELEVLVNGCYYDFATKKLVKGPVKLKYERKSYSI